MTSTTTGAERSSLDFQVVGGQLVPVAARLMKRRKQQFVSMPAHHVDMVLGVNGYLLVRPCSAEQPAAPGESGTAADQQGSAASASPAEQHAAVARAAAAVNALAALSRLITVEGVAAVVEAADENGVQTRDMLDAPFLERLQKVF